MKVVVLGGGFAGLSAAITLSERHHDVTLLERRGMLGGRASSYRDSVSGENIDTGAHVLFAAHHATLDLLQRAGAGHCVERLPAMHLDRGQGLGTVPLFSAALPAPWHALPGLIALRLAPRDLWLAWRTLRDTPSAAAANDTLATLLSRRGDDGTLLRRLFEPLCLLLCQAPAGGVSARLFLSALQATLTRTLGGARPLGFRAGLGEIHQHLEAFLEARAGRIVYGARAEKLELRDARVGGVRYNQRPRDRSLLRRGDRGHAERIDVDAVVSAVPWHALGALLPDAVRAVPPFSNLDQLSRRPATSMALWLERPVPARGLVGLVGTDLGWLRERRPAENEKGGGSRYWHASFTPATAQTRRNSELEAAAEKALQRAFPRLGPGNVTRGIVIREPGGTHAQDPEAIRLRPSAATSVAGLFLAGDWTDTGYPASIESAVLSGVRAAEALERAARHY